jgi:hypothetical protein
MHVGPCQRSLWEAFWSVLSQANVEWTSQADRAVSASHPPLQAPPCGRRSFTVRRRMRMGTTLQSKSQQHEMRSLEITGHAVWQPRRNLQAGEQCVMRWHLSRLCRATTRKHDREDHFVAAGETGHDWENRTQWKRFVLSRKSPATRRGD